MHAVADGAAIDMKAFFANIAELDTEFPWILADREAAEIAERDKCKAESAARAPYE